MSFRVFAYHAAIGFCLIILQSCLSNKKDLPDTYIQKARTAIERRQYQTAKNYIDSIRIVFPKDYDKIREGLQVMREIEFAEQKRTREYCDSLLNVRQSQFPDKQKNFSFQRNKAYESIGYYVNNHQLHKNNYNRTFLQTKVDEKGRLIVTSYYSGSQKINHTRLRLYSSDGLFVETQDVPRDGALNYAFRDGGIHYEIVRFNEKKLNGLINFILLNNGGNLKVELIGDINKTYTMRSEDKNALKAACELATVLSDITRLLEEIRLAQAKMDYIRSKQLNNAED
ncbi:MAG: hypothetical protein PHF38_04820 [Bacteroidales bacterium]|nr:hypothetical protein [Bacteroidales bacterium]MDD4361900.1 hypothetical protein [Bacteroidales bacterium]